MLLSWRQLDFIKRSHVAFSGKKNHILITVCGCVRQNLSKIHFSSALTSQQYSTQKTSLFCPNPHHQTADTSWVSSNLIPWDSVRSRRLNVQSPDAPATDTSHKSRPPELLTNQLWVGVPTTPCLGSIRLLKQLT